MGSFAESVELIHRLWTEDEVVFNGTYHSVDKPILEPRRKPKLWIGGGGERVTLKLVAQYGDACNLFARMGDDILKQKLDILRGHCEKVGRPYEEIEKTSLDHIRLSRDGADGAVTPAQAIERFAHLAEMGFDQGIISLRNPTDPETFELLGAEVIPEVEKIRPAGR